jgi:hypothetical protein
MPNSCYYEIIGGRYFLLYRGSHYDFSNFEQMQAFINDDSVLFIQVTENNWHDLYELGAFDDH